MANKVGNMRSRRYGPTQGGGGGLRSTLKLGKRSLTSLQGMNHKDSMDTSCTSLTSTTSSEAVVVILPSKTKPIKRKVRFAEENNLFYEPVKASSRRADNQSEEHHSKSTTSSTWYTRSDIIRFQDETERRAVVFLEHDVRAGELYNLYQSFLLPRQTRAQPKPEDISAIRTTPQSFHISSRRDANDDDADDEDDDDDDFVATRMIRGLEVYALPPRDTTFWEGFRELQSRKTASLYYKLFPERLSVALAHYCRQHSQPSQLYASSIVVAGDQPGQAKA